MPTLSPPKSQASGAERAFDPRSSPLASAQFSPTPPLHTQFGGYPILNHSGERAEILKNASTKILSKPAAEQGQLGLLHSLIDCSITRLGSAALLRDLCEPPTNFDVINGRRAAIMELRENSALRESLERALKKTQEVFYTAYSTEEWALRVFTPNIADRSQQKTSLLQRILLRIKNHLNDEREMMTKVKALGKLIDLFTSVAPANSKTLTDHLSTLQTLNSSHYRELLHGHVRKSVLGPIYAPKEAPWYEPTFSAHSGPFSFDKLALGPVTTLGLCFANRYFPISESSIPLLVLAHGAVGLFRRELTGQKFMDPLRERISSIPGLFNALDSIGELDALLALSKLPERFSSPHCFPRLVDSPRYTFTATSLHNPCQVMLGRSIPNDITLNGGTIEILTGPNSGGKSTLSTALFQTQILAQLGTCIPAESATMSVADAILLQGPTFAALQEHGRFGTELLETKNTFMRATPKSLVILDEVGDGTTAEERTEMAHAILWGFSRIGCGTLMVTHNTALARRAEEEGFANNQHLRISDGTPTYKLFPGISLLSNAERVAKAIGFSGNDIKASLKMRGYLS